MKSIFDKDRIPNKIKLKKLYIDQKLPVKKLSKLFKAANQTIKSWLKFYNLKEIDPLAYRRKKIPSKKTLEKLYCTKKKTLFYISNLFNVSTTLVANWLKKYKIDRRGHSELRKKKRPSKNRLYDLYVTQNRTINYISRIYGYSSDVIERWMREYNIKLLNREDTFKYKKAEIVKAQTKAYLNKYGVRAVSHIPGVYEKMVRNSFKHKDYVLPSGKIIQIQGFEHYAIDYLLTRYKEEDIKKECPIIPYSYLGKNRQYHPDIFIPKDNLIIEVKSDYLFQKQYNLNLKKRRATIVYFIFFVAIHLHLFPENPNY